MAKRIVGIPTEEQPGPTVWSEAPRKKQHHEREIEKR
jgi:hypothetical protein